MDLFKRENVKDYTSADLNCRQVFKHNKQANMLEKIIKRKARRNLKHKLKQELREVNNG